MDKKSQKILQQYREDQEELRILGKMLAKMFDWDSRKILRITEWALASCGELDELDQQVFSMIAQLF